MPRKDGRGLDELRPIRVTKDYIKYAEGSCLIEIGETKVICTATFEDEVPPFLKGSKTGWITAEYGMLPRSCETRVKRNNPSGRTQEIQRLIGRSLRAVVDLEKLGERTIKIDCDVIQADGGTRTAAITGSFIALAIAFDKVKEAGIIKSIPLIDYIAAVSVGKSENRLILDLDYSEDSSADMDMNVVMVGEGQFVEVQGTAEGSTFTKEEMDKLLNLAQKDINQLIAIQKQNLSGIDF